MLPLQASLYVTLLTFCLSLVNLNATSDANAGMCTPYPCNQPPSSTGYSPYGNPPPPSPPLAPPSASSPPTPPRSHCPPVPPGCCNQQPPPASTYYSPPYPYYFTPPYPYGTLGGGGEGGGGGQGGAVGGTGSAVAYRSPSVRVYVLMIFMFVLSYAFVVF